MHVVVRQRPSILELLSNEDQTLLVSRSAFLLLNLNLHVVDSIGRLNTGKTWQDFEIQVTKRLRTKIHGQINIFFRKTPNQTSISSVMVLLVERFHQGLNASATPTSACSPFGCCGATASTIFELLSIEDQTLLVRRDAFLVLDLGFHLVDRVGQVLGILNPCGWVTIPSPLQTTDKNLERRYTTTRHSRHKSNHQYSKHIRMCVHGCIMEQRDICLACEDHAGKPSINKFPFQLTKTLNVFNNKTLRNLCQKFDFPEDGLDQFLVIEEMWSNHVQNLQLGERLVCKNCWKGTKFNECCILCLINFLQTTAGRSVCHFSDFVYVFAENACPIHDQDKFGRESTDW